MFKTSASSKINLSYSDAPDELLWPYVEKVSNFSWFYCVYAINEGGISFKNILMLSNIQQLLNLTAQANVEIKDLYLVSTDQSKNGDTWGMKQLKKILQVTHSISSRKDKFYQYIFKDGSTYTDNAKIDKIPSSKLQFVDVLSL